MGMVFWHVTMSLDGFIAAPGDQMGWVFEHQGPKDTVSEVIRTTGAFLAGRRSYDVDRRDGVGPYGGAWSGPILVLTHRVPGPPHPPRVTFVNDGVVNAVTKARVAAGGKNVVLIGANLARQCLDAGLVDEILVHIVPTLLGAGVRFFEQEGAEPVRLQKIHAEETGPMTSLRYRVTSRLPRTRQSSAVINPALPER